MSHLLGAEKIHLEFPTRIIFDSLTLGLNSGDRVGIVGRNGDGKSTLLTLLAGVREPDSGQVTRRRGLRIGMLDQDDSFAPESAVKDVIVGELADHEWAGNALIRDVLAGLLGGIPWEAPVRTLSGGQRRRVALAALLAGEWDILLLDEPTNHLDVEGIAWLAEHLTSRWPSGSGALVVVTHDRWFLDEVCTSMWEVHDRMVEEFEGGYAAYVLQRLERDRMAAASEAKRQNLLRKELAWLRRGAPARTSKPKFRIDAANELIAHEPPIRDSVHLRTLAVARLGKDVIDIEDATVAFEGRIVLSSVTWRLAPGERTGILGVNGAGKSTLLGLLTGQVTPTNGRVKRGKTVKISALSQDLVELTSWGDDRVSEVIARYRSSYAVGERELTPGQMLERLGFSNQQLATPVSDLSGGQRRRLQFLLILLEEPNVLILDEPTNDLDTDMLAAMEDVLDSWSGTLVVVSHDRYLLERVTDQQYGIIDGHLRHLPGGVDQYLKLSASRDAPARDSSRPDQSVSLDSTTPASSTQLSGAERRSAEKERSSIDRKLVKLAEEVEQLHIDLADHDQSDYLGLAQLTEKLRDREADIADAETRWLELSEQLEN